MLKNKGKVNNGHTSFCVSIWCLTVRFNEISKLREKCIDRIDVLAIRDLNMILICFVWFLRFDKLRSQTINDLKAN